jgi:hypothetical protein
MIVELSSEASADRDPGSNFRNRDVAKCGCAESPTRARRPCFRPIAGQGLARIASSQ